MDKLRETALFRGMTREELQDALAALRAVEKTFRKGEIILLAGRRAGPMGLVLGGSVTVESNDAWGNRTILSMIGAGQIFAESYALLPQETMLVDVTANEDCRILFLYAGELDRLTGEAALWQRKLTRNLLRIAVRKNLHLAQRSFHTSPKTVRGRVMAYLNTVSLQKQAEEFDIPFDRQQLADYLNVERTALSKELGRMQKEGLIRVRRSHFVLLARGME